MKPDWMIGPRQLLLTGPAVTPGAGFSIPAPVHRIQFAHRLVPYRRALVLVGSGAAFEDAIADRTGFMLRPPRLGGLSCNVQVNDLRRCTLPDSAIVRNNNPLDLPRIVPVRIGLSLAFNQRQDHEPRRTSVQISAPKCRCPRAVDRLQVSFTRWKGSCTFYLKGRSHPRCDTALQRCWLRFALAFSQQCRPKAGSSGYLFCCRRSFSRD